MEFLLRRAKTVAIAATITTTIASISSSETGIPPVFGPPEGLWTCAILDVEVVVSIGVLLVVIEVVVADD